MPTAEDVIVALAAVQDPEMRRGLVYLDLVTDVRVQGSLVSFVLRVPSPSWPLQPALEAAAVAAVGALGGVDEVTVDAIEMTDAQCRALAGKLRPQTTSSEPHAGLGRRTRVLLIASGKGGVGKSSTTTNLAVALVQRGHTVGLLDADVWGFSIPRMLGVDRTPRLIDQVLVPPEVHGVRCMSMGFFARDQDAVVWRGPMLHKALEQFLTDVYWDDPDFLLIDLPPGTGDVSLSLAEFLPHAEMYVVTTPQPAAQRVAQRAANMAGQVKLAVRGVIENMSWFTGDDGKRYELFGAGGGEALAAHLQVPLIAQIPFAPAIREGADAGIPILCASDHDEVGFAYAALAERLAVDLAPTKRFNPGLRLLNQ